MWFTTARTPVTSGKIVINVPIKYIFLIQTEGFIILSKLNVFKIQQLM